MGKQIKSTALTLDGSSMGAAPVGPAGTVRLRPKSDSSALEVSYNGAAYVTLSAGVGGSTPRLDQVLDPGANKSFAMTTYTLGFDFSTATSTVHSWKVSVATVPSLIVGGTGQVGVGELNPSWDLSVSNRLRVGSPGVQDRQLFYESLSSESILYLYRYATDATPAKLIFQRARGTFSSPTALANLALDEIGSIYFWGYTGGTYDGPVISGSYTASIYTLKIRATAASSAGLTLDTTGVKIGGMSSNGVLYNDTSGYVASVGYTTSRFLKSSSVSSSFPPSWGVVNLASSAGDISGILPIANGGTGTSTAPTSGKLLIGNAAGGYTVANLTQSGAAVVTSGDGTIDVFAPASGALPSGGLNYIQYYASSVLLGGINPSVAGGVLVAPSIGGLASFVTTFVDGIRLTFNPNGTTPGLNVGSHSMVGNPSSPVNGDIYYNGTANKFKAYENGTWVDMIGGTAGTIPVSQGGTGTTTAPTSGQLLIGNAGGGYTVAALTYSGGAIVTTGSGTIDIYAPNPALPQGGTNYIQYYATSSTFGGINPSTAGGVFVAPSAGGLASFVTTFVDGVRLTFNPNGTNSGLNVGAHSIVGNPSSPVNGDIYYNSTSNKFKAYENSAWVDLIGAGGSMTVAGSGTELQYRSSGTALAALAGSSVSSASLTLSGDVTFERTGATYSGGFSTIIFNRENAGTSVVGNGEAVGGFTFNGRLAGGMTQLASISSYWETAGNGVLRLAARAGANARLEVSDSGSTANSVSMIATGGSHSIKIQENGTTITFTSSATATVTSMLAMTQNSSGTPATGFGQRTAYYLESSTTNDQIVGAQDVRWQVATHASRSAVMTFRTAHKAQSATYERMVLGGYKDMTDNSLADLFTVTFAAADQVAAGGEVHLLFVVKQVAGTVATQIYRRMITFIIGHNGATNTSMFNAREVTQAQASAASTGSITSITHAINSDSAVALATAIPTNPNVIATNVITYKMLVDSSLTTISQLSCFYHIIYSGELDITLS